jgi:pyruvate formate lyase activating enzyme
MLISSVTKSTFVDYPWKVACIVFTVGCNFRCPFCYNPECVIPEKIQQIKNEFIPDDTFFNFLKTRIWILDWVSICGWEPTLQVDLYDFIKRIKGMWFLVKLDTNWRDYDLVKKLIDEKLVDYIAIDFKNSPNKYEQTIWINLDKSFTDNFNKILNLILTAGIDYEYRTTLIKWYHTKIDVEAISKYLSWVKNYYLQNYISWKSLDPNFQWSSFSEKELHEFQQIALMYVENCQIR